MTKRWGYKHNGRDFVAYRDTREEAVKLFADVLGVELEHVEPIVQELPLTNEGSLIVDERRAPGA